MVLGTYVASTRRGSPRPRSPSGSGSVFVLFIYLLPWRLVALGGAGSGGVVRLLRRVPLAWLAQWFWVVSVHSGSVL